MKWQDMKPPVASGVLAYFPRALKAVAMCSLAGNEKYHPGTPLHWDKSKSTKQLDSMLRHITEHQQGIVVDPEDGLLHLTHNAWRALAALECFLIKPGSENGDIPVE